MPDVRPSAAMSLEVVSVPVSDVDRALAFYRDLAGFHVDVDYRPDATFRVVQLTPPQSSTSVQLRHDPQRAGSLDQTCLVVADIEQTARSLGERGVAVSPLRHKAGPDDWRGGFDAGTDPDRRDYATFADFRDPDGNRWLLQERDHRAPFHGILDGTGLHVDDTGGPGRPVVLLASWALSGPSWSAQIPALSAAGYRVITYDRRGFGRSERPRDAYDYDVLADDLRLVLDGLDLYDATVVGFSMGGAELVRYLSRSGSRRLRGVVFAATTTPYLLHSDDNPVGPLAPELVAGWAAAIEADPDAFFAEFVTGLFLANGQPAVGEGTRREILALTRQADKDAVLGCIPTFAETDLRGELPGVTLPTLVIHGDADAVVPLAATGEPTHRAVAGSELYVIAGGPHGIPMSHPDEFNRVLLDFLARDAI